MLILALFFHMRYYYFIDHNNTTRDTILAMLLYTVYCALCEGVHSTPNIGTRTRKSRETKRRHKIYAVYSYYRGFAALRLHGCTSNRYINSIRQCLW